MEANKQVQFLKTVKSMHEVLLTAMSTKVLLDQGKDNSISTLDLTLLGVGQLALAFGDTTTNPAHTYSDLGKFMAALIDHNLVDRYLLSRIAYQGACYFEEPECYPPGEFNDLQFLQMMVGYTCQHNEEYAAAYTAVETLNSLQYDPQTVQ